LRDQAFEQPRLSDIFKTIIFVTLALILPGLKWTIFGWLHTFLPLLSFFVFSKYGEYSGRKLLLTSAVIACVVYLVAGSIDLFVFAFILLLSGYVLFRAAQAGNSPALSGGKCAVTLTAGWLAIIFLSSIGHEANGYVQLIRALDQGVTEAQVYYRQSEDMSAETLAVLETTLYQMKMIVPIIMPAILGSMILIITWITMVLGNMLVLKNSGYPCWPKYQMWALPDRLIWILIAAAAFALLPLGLVRQVGINLLILLSIIYSFQGLAVAVFFMTKWNIPLLLRSFFYVMLIFQSFGTVLLLITGIADIWFDFRKIRLKVVDETSE